MRSILTKQAAVVLFFGLMDLPNSHAGQQPRWEAGAGIGSISLPHYRGADQRGAYAIPIPYVIYRGDILKADREGIRGLLYDGEQVKANISVNGTLPVNSKDNQARSGMPDLRPTVELGPTLEIRLWQSVSQKTTLELRTPLRTAITVESSPRQIGWVFAPNLNLTLKDPPRLPGWRLSLTAGPMFSDREYNAYFYSVRDDEATPARPQYAASGGYAGSYVTWSMSKRYSRFWAGGFVRYDTLTDTVFEDSPLLKRRNAVSVGLAFAWIFSQSSQSVSASD